MCCKHFGRIHRRKFKETTNKAIKKVSNTFVWAFIIKTKAQNFNRDDAAVKHYLIIAY